jgi:hypothetical protein
MVFKKLEKKHYVAVHRNQRLLYPKVFIPLGLVHSAIAIN